MSRAAVIRVFVVVGLIFISSAGCQPAITPEPTMPPTGTNPPPTPVPTREPTETPEPTPTFIPLPTMVPQTDSNCPSGGWTLYTQENGLTELSPAAIGLDRLGGIWAAYSKSTLNRMSNGKWFTVIKPYASGAINALVLLDDGGLWLGTQGGEAAYAKDHNWQHWTISVDNSQTAIYAAGVSPDGEVFLGTWEGLFTLVDGEFAQFSKPVPPNMQFTVKSINWDSDGGMWVGGKYNIHYYKDGLWGSFERSSEPYYDVVDIEEGPDGTMWFATMTGVYSYDGIVWNRNSPETLMSDKDPLSVSINSLAIGPDGRVWIVIRGGEVQVYQDGAWKSVPLEGVGPDVLPKQVEVDYWGALWFATNQGVLCYLP